MFFDEWPFARVPSCALCAHEGTLVRAFYFLSMPFPEDVIIAGTSTRVQLNLSFWEFLDHAYTAESALRVAKRSGRSLYATLKLTLGRACAMAKASFR